MSEMRCAVTKNPCGTDTRGNGAVCKCLACQLWLIRQDLVVNEKPLDPEFRAHLVENIQNYYA